MQIFQKKKRVNAQTASSADGDAGQLSDEAPSSDGTDRPARQRIRPEPRSLGVKERGQLLLANQFATGGTSQLIPDGNLWKLGPQAEPLQKQLLGFEWLDDLAALRNREAIHQARKWVFDWFRGTASNHDLTWRADIAGRRVIRLRHHEDILLLMAGVGEREFYQQQVQRHGQKIRKNAGETRAGLPRIEALAGLVYAELAEQGNRAKAMDALQKLADAAAKQVKHGDGIQSRNPQELLNMTELMQWCVALASKAGIALHDDKLQVAIRNAATILRPLRHVDGSLTRFHGGGNPSQLQGQLDRVLAEAGPRESQWQGLAMGFARMSAGRTSVICDAASPHSGKQSHHAHASTLAFELVTGMTSIVVSRGPGEMFGRKARHQARQTASYSTVEIDENSSSRMNAPVFKRAELDDIIVVFPDQVRVEQLPDSGANALIVSHNGYAPLFGLTHIRRIDMNSTGDHIWAEDTLWAQPGEDQRVLQNVMSTRTGNELPFISRFHLHPMVKPILAKNHRQVHLDLMNGEQWIYEMEGKVKLQLEPSVYFDEIKRQTCESHQIVFHSVVEPRSSTQMRWAFRRVGRKS